MTNTKPGTQSCL